ncbi:MinD/ParA family protein [Microbacterium sp. NPDC078428]|uniref:MinD/ParA family protein n=1 Tax=Microbacterium sp. NPDC078428 TaxID=3364190 RepID=UPI0037CC9B7E
MSPHGPDSHPDENPDEHPDNGLLSTAPSVDTSGIGILGATTAHVEIVLPAHDDEEDDDVVDDDVLEEDVEVIVAELADDDPAVAAEPPQEPDPEPEPVPEPVAAAPRADATMTAHLGAEDSSARAGDEPGGDAVTDDASRAENTTAAVATRAAAREVTRHAPAEPAAPRRIGDIAQGSVRETPDLLTADRLLDSSRLARPEPDGAWRHLLYSATRGRINLGDSRRARERKDLDRRIAAPLPGSGARFVAVMSRKGGVGKTTVTTLLGMALADARDDRVIAVDANPDRGTLAERITRRSEKTVRDLVRESESLRGYNDVSAIVARDETRLDVLASDTDPHVSEAFSDEEYRTVARVADHYYSIVLTDTGTGIVHSVTGATLERADQLIVVAGMSIDEARLASETLTWLESNGHEERVRDAIVVLNMASPGSALVRPDQIEAHFRSRVRDVVRVPYDAHIATGGAITFRDLPPATRAAARQLAVKVVDALRGAPAPSTTTAGA